MTRRNFLTSAAAFAGYGAFGPPLWAAMKYDKKAVLFGKEWRTAIDAEASGRYVMRGFYGTYWDVSVLWYNVGHGQFAFA